MSLTFFSAEVLKFCQLRILNSFVQQRFSLWYKVNRMKFRPLAYLGIKHLWCYLASITFFTKFWIHFWNLFDILMVTYCMHSAIELQWRDNILQQLSANVLFLSWVHKSRKNKFGFELFCQFLLKIQEPIEHSHSP